MIFICSKHSQQHFICSKPSQTHKGIILFLVSIHRDIILFLVSIHRDIILFVVSIHRDIILFLVSIHRDIILFVESLHRDIILDLVKHSQRHYIICSKHSRIPRFCRLVLDLKLEIIQNNILVDDSFVFPGIYERCDDTISSR